MPSPVYVLTRNGRRADPGIYNNKSQAEARFYQLVASVNKSDPSSKNEIKIVKTSTPYLIR